MGLVATALANGTAVENGADNTADDASWSQDAIETQRGLIGAVPGDGDVLGIFEHEDEIYAFRNNVTNTAAVLHQATSTGWAEVTLNERVAFSAGTAEVFEGETLTQAGVTATVIRVNLVTGKWVDSNAAGYIVLSTVAGGSYAAATIATTASGSLTTDGAEAVQTLAPGGRYEVIEHNFYAVEDRFRVYGVSGVHPAFDFDGTDFSLLTTANTDDTPDHLAAHHMHLFLSFGTGSVQHSALGLPADFTTANGASELGFGDKVKGFKGLTGGTLGIWGADRTKVLHGSAADGNDLWLLKDLSDEAGAEEWTIQTVGRTRYLDDRGITSLEAVQAFGDFKSAVFTQNIERFIEARRGTAVASLVVHPKNQYRLFYSDRTGITVTFDGYKVSGITIFKYLHDIKCTSHAELNNGSEVLFFGSDDGFVYKIDSGTSFDGENIDALLSTNYVNCGSPSYDKRFRKVSINAEAPAGAVISYQANYDYGAAISPATQLLTQIMEGSGGLWDFSLWDQFVWADDAVSQIEGGLSGIGRNASISISSSSAYTESYTIYDMTLHYSMRRLVR